MQVGSRSLAVGLVAVLLVFPAGVAGAEKKKTRGGGPGEEAVTTVTLKAKPSLVAIGKPVTLSGAIDPAAEGESVTILDRHGKEVATIPTDPEGRYETSFVPAKNRVLHAEWALASSDEVKVRVRPEVNVKLKRPKLFGKARIRGWVRPAAPSGRVHITFRRWGKVIAQKTVSLSGGRRFRAKFKVPGAGGYRARAALVHDDLAPGSGWTAVKETLQLKNLSQGATDPLVKALERRLISLGYYLPSANQTFDEKTRDALIAFNKVQGTERVGTSVDRATWGRLISPKKPKARYGGKGRHFEIDQTRQVVLVVQNGRVRWIIHTSTGAGGATHDGTFHVSWKLAGYSAGGLYYPSYWDGGRAFHGWPDVPTYPASHGCSRLPMWSATWMYSLTEIGDAVYVYH